MLKNKARLPFRDRKLHIERDRKLHIEFKFAEMCLGVHSGGKKIKHSKCYVLQCNAELSVNNQNILMCELTETRVM